MSIPPAPPVLGGIPPAPPIPAAPPVPGVPPAPGVPAAPPVSGVPAAPPPPSSSTALVPVPESGLEPALSNIQPIPVKKTLLIVNHFIIHTTNFLNNFAKLAEQKLSQVHADISKLEIVLAILEAKLNSIDWLGPAPVSAAAAAPAAASVPAAPAANVPAAPPVGAIPAAPPVGAVPAAPPAPAVEEKVEPPAAAFVAVSQDPLYANYFKMLRLGVPKEQLKMKLRSDGHEDYIIDMDPMAPSPNPNAGAAPEQSKALVPVHSDDDMSDHSDLSD